MRIPDITPQKWYENLRELPSSVTEATFAIFTGEVNGLTNLVVRIVSNSLSMAIKSTNMFWRFNYERGEFEAVVGVGSDWSSQVIEQSGRRLQVRGAYTVAEVTMKMVDYKLSPAE